jgi:hypothetical protein
MPTKQSAADAPCHSAKGTSPDSITDERTADTAGYSADCSVAAAAALRVDNLAMVTVPIMASLCRLWDKHWP